MSTNVAELIRNFCTKCSIVTKGTNPLWCTKCGNMDLIPEPKEYVSLDEEPVLAKDEVDLIIGAIPHDVYPPNLEKQQAPKITIDPEVKKQLEEPFAFVTGSAGTGKSTLLRLMAELDPQYGELTSTTGIAAVNLGGRTLNSVLKYFNTKSLENIWQSGKLHWQLRNLRNHKRNLVIEEVSMLDAEQLSLICSAVDEINNDTTGKRLGIHLVGDFFQLPPVNAEFCFKSPFWERFDKNTIKLNKIWRQDNLEFVKAMNYARAGDGNSCIAQLIDCGVQFKREADKNFDGTTLISLNEAVDSFNNDRLKELKTPMIRVVSRKLGLQAKEWDKLVPIELRLKVGAYVMILSNDIPDFRYVNGDCGYVKSYNAQTDKFEIELLRTKEIVKIGRVVRENMSDKEPVASNFTGGFTPYPNHKTGEWVVGTISYHPLRLAWASSVHKSQGLSLDRVQIDTRANFFGYPALAYVALSRARTADGMVLVGDPTQIARKIQTSPEVKKWI